jgi:hypothetical protein
MFEAHRKEAENKILNEKFKVVSPKVLEKGEDFIQLQVNERDLILFKIEGLKKLKNDKKNLVTIKPIIPEKWTSSFVEASKKEFDFMFTDTDEVKDGTESVVFTFKEEEEEETKKDKEHVKVVLNKTRIRIKFVKYPSATFTGMYPHDKYCTYDGKLRVCVGIGFLTTGVFNSWMYNLNQGDLKEYTSNRTLDW